MRSVTLVLVLTALGPIASAQPGPPPQPPPFDTTTPADPVVEPAPTPPPTPAPAPTPPVVREAPVEAGRPEGLSFALGVGYGLPTSLETPNRTSLRVRFASGMQLEPLVTISNTTTKMDSPTMEREDKDTLFGLSAIVRFPLITHNKVDFEFLGTATFSTEKENPEGDYNTKTINSFGVGYGVAVAYWISRHWNFSMSVTNPVVSYDQTKQQTGPGGMRTTTGDTTIGLIFVPSVFMMIHLYN